MCHFKEQSETDQFLLMLSRSQASAVTCVTTFSLSSYFRLQLQLWILYFLIDYKFWTCAECPIWPGMSQRESLFQLVQHVKQHSVQYHNDMTLHYCLKQLKATLLPGWRCIPGMFGTSDTSIGNLKIQCTQNHGEQMVSSNIKHHIVCVNRRPADWISHRFCLNLLKHWASLTINWRVRANRIKLLVDIFLLTPILVKVWCAFQLPRASIATKQSENTISWHFCLHIS